MRLGNCFYIKVGFRFMLIPLLLVSGDVTAKGIYHKGWMDFNKNGKMDVYENPDAWPTPLWKQENWKDGIANIDEQANGLIG